MTGSYADIVILDPNKEMVVSEETYRPELDWNVFEGIRVKGIPVLTMLRGSIIA